MISQKSLKRFKSQKSLPTPRFKPRLKRPSKKVFLLDINSRMRSYWRRRLLPRIHQVKLSPNQRYHSLRNCLNTERKSSSRRTEKDSLKNKLPLWIKTISHKDLPPTWIMKWTICHTCPAKWITGSVITNSNSTFMAIHWISHILPTTLRITITTTRKTTTSITIMLRTSPRISTSILIMLLMEMPSKTSTCNSRMFLVNTVRIQVTISWIKISIIMVSSNKINSPYQMIWATILLIRKAQWFIMRLLTHTEETAPMVLLRTSKGTVETNLVLLAAPERDRHLTKTRMVKDWELKTSSIKLWPRSFKVKIESFSLWSTKRRFKLRLSQWNMLQI